MSLEDLERKLYGDEAGLNPKKENKKLETSEKKIPETWGDEIPTHSKEDVDVSHRKTYIIGGLGIFAVAIGALALLFTGFGSSRASVELDALVPSEIARGVPFDFSIEATNQSNIPVTNGTVEIRLPQGIRPVGGNQVLSVMSESVGSISPGALVRQSFKLLPTGDVDTVQKITAVFSYVSGSGGKLETTFTKEISISKSAASLTVVVPDRVIAGSSFDTVVTYKNDTETELSNLVLRVTYPTAFRSISATPKSTGDDGSWVIPKLKANGEGKIVIRGFLTGGSDGQAAISASLVSSAAELEYKVAEATVGVSFSPSPVSLSILVNGRSDYVAQTGEALSYAIRYENSSGIALAGAVITAQISSPLIDQTTVKTLGSFNSSANVVTWTAAQIPALKLVEPGASGSVEVRFNLKSGTPTGFAPKNFAVKFVASLESPSVPYYLNASSTSATASTETRVGGDIIVSSKIFYRDATFASSSGPFPPKVNTGTGYTVHWLLKNAATDVHDVVVRASLKGGVSWSGKTKTTEGVLSYDEQTREVTWTIDRIPAMKGIATNPAEAIFQIEGTPSITQVGQVMPLLSEMVAEAIDDFTGVSLASRFRALTSNLPDDPSVAQNSGKVLP